MTPNSAKKPLPLEFMTEFQIGCKRLEAGLDDEAEKHFDNCARHCPEAWLGVACEDLRDGRAAMASRRFEQVLKYATHDKTRSVALNNVGMLLNNHGKRSESEPLFKEAFQLWKRADTALNVALCCMYAARMTEANHWIKKATMLDPGNHQIWFNKGLISLLQGDFRNGFREYESRWKNPGSNVHKLPVMRPEWNGENLEGKTLLVYGEQGAGDTLQMLRYGPLLKARGCKLLLAPQVGLGSIAERQGCWDGIYEDILQRIEKGNVPEYDLQVPAMNLPRIFNTTPDTIPPAPYLPIPDNPHRFSQFNVGFCWAGSVDHAHDIWRSTHLEDWKPLFELPGIRWHSFQIGHRTIDALGGDYQFEDYTGQLKTYLDTAWAMAPLDLIISVDTSLVHLAGAIGKPCWMLTPFCPDWRWMMGREDSPWYPSVRLFRQTKELQWSDVFERVRAELEVLRAAKADESLQPVAVPG